MIAVDTNILLRYIMQDDPIQSRRATDFIESFSAADPVFVPLICLTELYWVLDHTYKLSGSQIRSLLQTVATSDSLLLEASTLVGLAIFDYANGSGDFDDCLIAQTALASGCDATFTFDKDPAKSGIMRLLE